VTPRITAIITAYNEADVIGQVVADLAAQGISVYLIDHRSSDDTVAEARRAGGSALVGVERFPDESGFPEEDAHRFALRSQLQRKEQLAARLDADWLVHADADELRESPWLGTSFAEGIAVVDRLGYNAIDFAVLHFHPTHDRFRRGDDLRASFPFYEAGASFDQTQVRCWKNPGAPVDLASEGGHEVQFAGRRIFPLRFLLRHYPLRGQAHAERKILEERRPRMSERERREYRWHVQYDDFAAGQSALRDPASLLRFDPAAARRALREGARLDEVLQALRELGLA
jgi:glycosyltransferase involved in cell wall biosynthesis